MSYFKHSLCVSVLVLLCVPAWAINKCTAADGSVVFQDAPCNGRGEVLEVKPAAGRTKPLPSGAQPVDEAQRLEDRVTASQRERRLRELQTIYYPQAQSTLDQHRRACEQEQKDLAANQYKYTQNLYGKTHAAQVAAEMAAAASRCDLKDRELKEKLDAMKTECNQLGGCR